MTMDIPGPEGLFPAIEIAPRAASAVADAKGHALGEVIPLKDVADFFAHKQAAERQKRKAGNAVFAQAQAVMADAAQQIADIKNVKVTPEDCDTIAELALGFLAPESVYLLAKNKPGADAPAAAAINRIIDIYAATGVIRLVLELLGYDHLDHAQIVRAAEDWVKGIVANAEDYRFRWPEPAAMATVYFRSRTRGPVLIQYPARHAMRAAYCLDRSSEFVPGTLKPSKNVPMPLLLRCPLIPDLPGSVIPNGRLVRNHPDGSNSTTWWKDGKPSEEPEGGEAVP